LLTPVNAITARLHTTAGSIYNRAMRRSLILVLALAACGKVSTLTDAPVGSGSGADAMTGGPDAPPAIDADLHGPITVIVNDTNAPATPLAGVPVVFVNPDGSVVAEPLTDANGKATATVLPGASVTAVYGGGTLSVQLETVRAVAPGDTIVIGPLSGAGGNPSGTFTATVPDYAGSVFYDVYGPCGSNTANAVGSGAPTPVTLSMQDNCQQTTMDLVAIAKNSDKTPDAWVEAKNVAYTDGGNATMGSGWQPFQTLSLSFSNVAASSTSSIYIMNMAPDANGYQVATYGSTGTEPQTATLQVPGTATALVETDFTHNSGGGQQQMYDVVDGTKTTYAVDLSTALLPYINFPTLDPASGAVTVPGATTAGDILDVNVQFSRVINTQSTNFYWEIWTPPTGSFTLPAMPADLATDYPATGDGVGQGTASLYAADAITDWAQVRGHLFGALDAYYLGRTGLGRFIWSYPTGVGFAPTPRSGGLRGHQRAARIRR
jgi:hypothetical protein